MRRRCKESAASRQTQAVQTGFPIAYRQIAIFPLTRDMTTFWAPSALLITIRHARRFVCAGFSRKQATDHNHSTNHNRSSEQANSGGRMRSDVESRFMDCRMRV